MDRRQLLLALLAAPLVSSAEDRSAKVRSGMSMDDIDRLRTNWRDWLAPGADVAMSTQRLERSDAEWQEILTPARYQVLRKEGTERPFTSPLNDEKGDGVYVCAGCSLPLFTSAMKFDSGTGWPSFFTSIPDAVETKRDFKLILPRTEYHCARCGGHQGHVFKDGPAPTHERWCNNGVALRFVPKTS